MRREEEQELTHQSSSLPVSVHWCWPSLSGHSSSFAGGQLVGGHLYLWAFASVCPHSFLFMGTCFHLWVSTFIGGWSSPLMHSWLHWWVFMFSVVVRLDSHGHS